VFIAFHRNPGRELVGWCATFAVGIPDAKKPTVSVGFIDLAWSCSSSWLHRVVVPTSRQPDQGIMGDQHASTDPDRMQASLGDQVVEARIDMESCMAAVFRSYSRRGWGDCEGVGVMGALFFMWA
jgi:hypothetical protein